MSTRKYFEHRNWKKGFRYGIRVRIEALSDAEKGSYVKIESTYFDQYKIHLEGLGPHVVQQWASTMDVFFMNSEDAVMFKLKCN